MTTLNFLFKFALLSAALFIFSESGVAQDKSERLSPPKSVEQTVNGGLVVIDYSSPAQNDREIWGNLVPYDKVWRTGANEATTISFEKDVTIVKNPGRQNMEIIKKEGEKISRYTTSHNFSGEGKGKRVGVAYELENGEIVYVPETSE